VFLIARVGETEGAEELVLEVVTTVEDVPGLTEGVVEGFVELVVGSLGVLVLVEVFVEETDETVEVVKVFEVLTVETVGDFVELVVGTAEVVVVVDDLLLLVEEIVV
jgi:hypothetical protein